VVSFTHRLLYPQGKSPWNPLLMLNYVAHHEEVSCA